jgi:hypothetical protein
MFLSYTQVTAHRAQQNSPFGSDSRGSLGIDARYSYELYRRVYLRFLMF